MRTAFPCLNTLRPRQDGRHFPDDIFKRIFLNENVWIALEISLNFVPKGPINNILALVQIMTWRRPGDKSLSEPMMVSLPTHKCVTRPQWVNVIVSILHSLFLYVLQQLCFTWVQVGYLIGLIAVIHSIGGPAAYRFFNTFYPDAAVLGIAALDGVISYAYLAIPVMSSTYVYFGMF